MAHDCIVLPVDAYGLSPDDVTRFAEELALGVVPVNDPALITVALPVPTDRITASRIQVVIDQLITVARGQLASRKYNPTKRRLVGLAAPQIGTSLRIVIVDTAATPDRKHGGKLECFINPEIIWRSRETAEGREGCFSAGPVWGLVHWPIAVKIQAYDRVGRRVERIFEGFTARIVQHEIDHLQGIRFPERITSDRKRHWVHTEELAVYPDHIKHWPRRCSRERWDAFRFGR